MGDDLEARLKSHAKAFEGLMALIPAKDYYGKDESITSTQWMKTKKQSKEEKRAAKRAKLDPANHKSAKDVMDENARKRKRELEGEQADDSSDFEFDGDKEKPREGMKVKKQKTAEESRAESQQKKQAQAAADKDAKAKAKADKLKQKREKKKEQQAQKQQAKKVQQEDFSKGLTSDKESEDDDDDDDVDEDTSEWVDEQEDPEDRIEALDVSGLVEDGQSTATQSAIDSNTSTASVASSSASSLPPADAAESSKKTAPVSVAPKTHNEFRERLSAKLSALRAARKAEGPNGQPAKNRAELIEARRKKEADRKAAKKAQKQIAKDDAERVKAEDQLERIRGGSGSPSVFSHRSTPEADRNFNFGRVAWNDGQQLDGSLSSFLDSKKRKGKSDPKTALEAAKNKQARLAGLDEEKRKKIEEQDLWLAAKKRAQGERVHNDPKLLKKSVKRLEKGKLKSEKEWNERKSAVDKGKEQKQKRREANLQKRREEKGVKGKKKPGSKKTSAKGKGKGKRPGFEGSMKK